MFTGSHAETGDDRNAAAERLPRVIGNVQTEAGSRPLGQGAKNDCPHADRPFPGISGRTHARFGILWLTALTFSMMKEAGAADPNVVFLDDGSITYKDLEHGSFELVTKEPIPRHFVVEDPGETIVLRVEGSSINISRVTNSSSRMAELQAAQQEALATLAKGMESSGSSTPPLVDRLPVQPINFIETDVPTPTGGSLLPLPVPNFPSTQVIIALPPVPPTLNAVTGPTEIDTSAFDTFTATSGTFVASSTNSTTLTYGISGGTAGSTVLDGETFDVSQTGPYGTLYVDSTTGDYTFVPDSHAINALTEPTTTSFTVTVSDGALAASQTFTIAINGTNDAAVISGAATGSTVEASGVANRALGAPTVTGTLTNTDVDNPHDTFTAIETPIASAGGYGSFAITANGVWTYTLDETNAAVQALNVGGTLTDTFTVTTVDGTAKLVTVTIQGANDAAVISGATAGAVIEAGSAGYGTPSATGTLTDTDVDNTPNSFTPVDSPTASAGGHGTYTLTADGVWTYALDDCDHAVQALNIGDTLIDTFTVTTIDGTPQVVTVTIQGTNDAAIIYGTTTGSVTEAGHHEPGKPTACGTLTNTDIDNTPNTFTAVSTPTVSAGGYGTFTMTADGKWTYTVDDNNGAVQALNSCDTLCDSFTVTTIDGTAQVVKVTIQGANDPAVISGATTGSVIEAACHEYGQPIACGTLTNTDVDNAPDTFTPVCWPEASAGGYGTFTMTAAGVWTYTLDNNNCTVQALNSCDTLCDSFTVTTIDGTAQVVKVTIQGANDPAVISGTTAGCVVEAGCDDQGNPVACGTLTNTDVDNTPNTFTPVCWPEASAGGYGTFTMTAAGVWTYTLDNANCTVQALNDCDTLCDSFTVTTIDGTAQEVKITIYGTSDGFDFKASAAGESFQFNDEMMGFDASNAIDPLDVDFSQAAISPSEGQLATSAGAQTLAPLSGNPADDNFSFVLEPLASAAAFHAPHDLMV
ncbi:VCBS domain-containing protein [Bradyrhizobium sp. AUGA SZCCT0240]|uniref:VCBS domain-containing protein n=1 Tax=unclassified Bradyrhizobium TaxID=2631580 RepID=UPI001BACC3E2|nr:MULTISPECIES: VCBS domain-containing protein [unclassified Bradyrhizobium]MBR1196058.1 VCBS domain-containing protein [Bradyrhizobium sp. AUGA SZCCT0158]MBR1240895.1 VCBS domain-containing protein [Bradyrhizobium sp. AUGA SZCCT0274]MBR1252082.1 VCBS domain-containing protein [Bradyrhizobium sp. AUGA SZCCT0240]